MHGLLLSRTALRSRASSVASKPLLNIIRPYGVALIFSTAMACSLPADAQN